VTKYTAKDIEVLEGLEPVRARPAMYIGGTDARGYHHLLWEVVDNSVDEAINGHANRIEVVLDKDRKGATVTDNGRGIPIDKHPKFKRTALELILTTLHAGGKFGRESYKVSGGLHGVGASVVNALSEELTARVRRDGVEYEQSFSRGKPRSQLKKVGKATRRGTVIHFRPDPKIFGDKLELEPPRVKERLEAHSYLHRGLRVAFKDERTGEEVEFEHPGGIAEYLVRRVSASAARGPCTCSRSPTTGTRTRGWRSPSSGRRHRTSSSSPTRTGSRPRRVGATRTASSRRSARPCAGTCRPTTWRRRG
jgi:DNA gyrase subunit B